MSWTIYESPVGPLTVVASPSKALSGIYFPDSAPALPASERVAMEAAVSQLDEYFAGERRVFHLDVELRGTPLQQAVWARLREIPYGETRSYGEIADGVKASFFAAGTEHFERARSVGSEIGRTPVPIVVPCHRVVGADGSLIGFGGGLQRKRALLDLEQGVAQLLPLA